MLIHVKVTVACSLSHSVVGPCGTPTVRLQDLWKPILSINYYNGVCETSLNHQVQESIHYVYNTLCRLRISMGNSAYLRRRNTLFSSPCATAALNKKNKSRYITLTKSPAI